MTRLLPRCGPRPPPTRRRAWIFAPGEAAQGSIDVRWVDAETADFVPPPTNRHGTQVPVVVTPDAQAGKDEQCPSCGLKDGIRYLGSRVATLASVTLGQLFGSPDVTAAEKKTLVFTDSVQDASHRAAFVESRAYALNMRALLHRAVGGEGRTLATVGRSIEESARTPAERYAMLPPDLREHEVFRGYWNTDKPTSRVRQAVAKRMSFTATLEFGLSSRTARTSELTGAVTAHAHVDDLAGAVGSALAAVERQDVQLALDGVGPQRTSTWARGIVERIRTHGGIGHVWLRKFAASGNRHKHMACSRARDELIVTWSGTPSPFLPSPAA